jgi:DNA recombination protein RmuC
LTSLLLVLTSVVLVLQITLFIFFRKSDKNSSEKDLEKSLDTYSRQIETAIREEFSRNRSEFSKTERDSRDESSANLSKLGVSLDIKLEQIRSALEATVSSFRDSTSKNLEDMKLGNTADSKNTREEINSLLVGFNNTTTTNIAQMGQLQKIQLDTFGTALESLKTSNADSFWKLRNEVGAKLIESNDSVVKTLGEISNTQMGNLEKIEQKITALIESLENKSDAQRVSMDEKLKNVEASIAKSSKDLREEVQGSVAAFNTSVHQTISVMADSQSKQFETSSTQLSELLQSNHLKLESLRTTVENKLKDIQADNTKQLDQMRQTVDEKLQSTLDKRLGDSFKQVSDRLEAVHKGLGEMQTLAAGVGDIKKVLSNVKIRGTMAEVQLGCMLEQVLSPNQYQANVSTKNNAERVDFAVKLPGRGGHLEEVVWLPIDAKFPQEDYLRLVDAWESADPIAVEAASKKLESNIKNCAKTIAEKYLNPPKTTDFAILFLPTEGLFAEVTRRPGLAESLQREQHVVVAGPTTLWSILNSFQMGFQTLAIEKRSSEVWKLLAAVKTEWTRYGGVLEQVEKKLQAASKSISDVAIRNRAVGKRLKTITELSDSESKQHLGLDLKDDLHDDEIDVDELGSEESEMTNADSKAKAS